MPWSDDTRCLFCNGKLPLYRRLKQGQFCSQAHHQEYEAQQEQLGLERLFETHSNLQAARPKVSAEAILGPEPVSTKRPAYEAPEPPPAPSRRDTGMPVTESIDALESLTENPEPVEAVFQPLPKGPEEGVCLHCGKKLPLFQALKRGQFCSKAHQADYGKAQDLLGLERLFETHSSLQALRPAAGAESILGPEPVPSVTLSQMSSSDVELPIDTASWIEQVPVAAAEPGYASKLQQDGPNFVPLPPSIMTVDPLHYEAAPQPQSSRFDLGWDRTATAILTPSFADRVQVDLGGRRGLRTEATRADVIESLGTLGRNMFPSALQATAVPADAEPFTGRVAIAGRPNAAGVGPAPSLATRVGADFATPAISASAVRLSAVVSEVSTGLVAFASLPRTSSESVLCAAELLPIGASSNYAELRRVAESLGSGPIEWSGAEFDKSKLSWPEFSAKGLVSFLDESQSEAEVRTYLVPPSAEKMQRLEAGMLGARAAAPPRGVNLELDPGTCALSVALPASSRDAVPVRQVLQASSDRLASLVWRSSELGAAHAVSISDADSWAVASLNENRVVPALPAPLSQSGIRNDLECLALPFVPISELSAAAAVGLGGAEAWAAATPTKETGRKLELVGDAALSLLEKVCSPGEKLLRLPESLNAVAAGDPQRRDTGVNLDFQNRSHPELAKPDSISAELSTGSNLAPALGDVVEMPVAKSLEPSVSSQPVEVIELTGLSNEQLAASLSTAACKNGSFKPQKNHGVACKLLQPLMVLFRLAYLRNSQPKPYAMRVQGSVLPEFEAGQAILPKFRGRPESNLGVSQEPEWEGPIEYAARPAVGVVSAWTGFWHNAPRDLKILLVCIPLLAALAFSPGIPKVSLHTPEGNGISTRLEKAVSFQLASLRKSVLERAAVALDEDFRQGLDDWVGKGGATTEWSFDETGFVRPGPLALYRPSRGLTDYKMEFLGLIDSKALSWVVRAVDFQNYYVIKLAVVKAGQVPELQLTRYAVIDGKPQDRIDTPVYLRGRGDLPYRISVNLEGDKFSVYVQNLLMDSWNEPRLTHGGIGFFTAHGEQSRVRWVQVTHQYDTLGRLCAFLAPSEFSNTPEER